MFLSLCFVGGWFVMFIIKTNLIEFYNDVNMIRCWLYMECVYIFMWLIASIIFVTSA